MAAAVPLSPTTRFEFPRHVPTVRGMLALQALTPELLCAHLPDLLPKEARKVVATIHRDQELHGGQGIRKVALAAIAQAAHVPTLRLHNDASSSLDPFRKFVLETHDGHLVETVRIPLEKEGRHSVCVSSQVGCAMACSFCATGRLGLTRNLEAWEIVEQVRVVRRSLAQTPGTRVHGVVFQGMGEPMANLDNVLQAIHVLTDPCAQSIDGRAMTVCTSGHPSGIRRLAQHAPAARLGISIGSARPQVRSTIMPLDRVHPLVDVLDAAVEHATVTGLAPMWAVTLLRDVNDTPEDAHALADLASAFRDRCGRWPGVTIVPYNRIDSDDTNDPYRRTTDERETAFRDLLASRSVFAKKRYSGGSDVGAACGQLAARGSSTPQGRAILGSRG
jgi:23S rRNA (adenine2503-C2)-methyltransferase